MTALRRALPRDVRLLIAVSGGADSVALLHGVSELRAELRLSLAVAHVDHGLRRSSATDARFVSALAEKFALPVFVKKCRKAPKGANVEAWGRDQRYRFFTQILRRYRFDYVITAHTADDAAETLLMRLVSNKELRGILAADKERRCLRPLLTVTRAEVQRYCIARGIRFREDPTNRDETFLRNRVRRRLIPLLAKEFDPHITLVLERRAAALDEQHRFLDALVAKQAAPLLPSRFSDREWLRSVRARLKRADPALRWRIAELLLRDLVGFALGRSKGLELVEFFLGDQAAIQLPGAVTLRRRGGALAVSREVG